MLTIRVDGSIFRTTYSTIKCCRDLVKLIDTISSDAGDSNLVVDRDATVFSKVMKLLRGYPCNDYRNDVDVLHELCYWNHEMCDVVLPEFFDTIPISEDSALAVHTYDQRAVSMLSKTHILLPKKSFDILEELDLLADEPGEIECNFIGTNCVVNDVVWLSNADFSVAKMRYKFDNFFRFK